MGYVHKPVRPMGQTEEEYWREIPEGGMPVWLVIGYEWWTEKAIWKATAYGMRTRAGRTWRGPTLSVRFDKRVWCSRPERLPRERVDKVVSFSSHAGYKTLLECGPALEAYRLEELRHLQRIKEDTLKKAAELVTTLESVAKSETALALWQLPEEGEEDRELSDR